MRGAWIDADKCDLNGCLSILFRDMILSTSFETTSVIVFIVRCTLVMTYLITNMMTTREGNVPRVRTATPQCMDEVTRATFVRYWAENEEVNLTRLISTIVILMIRLYIGELFDLPRRLIEASQGDGDWLREVQRCVAHTTRSIHERTSHDKAMSWTHMLQRANCSNKSTGGGCGGRGKWRR